jgi:hypothetical protein
MKKLLFLFGIIAAFCVRASAQGQGQIFIDNQTSCNATINVHAVCYDQMTNRCTWPNSQTMWKFPNNGGPYLYPGMGQWGTTPCPNWEWQYAEILIGCPNGTMYSIYPGGIFHPFCGPAPGITMGPHVAETDICDCAPGGLVNATWYYNPGTGDITITLY